MWSVLNSIAESFNNNLIAENRYRMILDGLQVTLLITFCSVILGTLLGGLVCWARMSRHTWLRNAAKVYIDRSPLDDAARASLRPQVKELIEEPTTRGFRIKLII